MAKKTNNKNASAKTKKDSAQEKPLNTATGPQRRRNPTEEPIVYEAILDDKSRRDIGGILFVIIAVVFFVLAIAPTNALVSGFASEWVHLLLGTGSYILPFVLLAISVSYFKKLNSNITPARIAIGLSLVFIALLGVFALFAPTVVLGEEDYNLLFSDNALRNYGGYIGSSITWCGLVLFGRAITAVILVGLIVIGCIIVGFSISSAIESMRSHASKIGDISFGSRNRDSAQSGGFARMRQHGMASPYDLNNPDVLAYLEAESSCDDFDPDNTFAFGMGRLAAPDDSDGGAVTRKLAPPPENLPAELMDQAPTRRCEQMFVSENIVDHNQIDDFANPEDFYPLNESFSFNSRGLVPIVHDDISVQYDFDLNNSSIDIPNDSNSQNISDTEEEILDDYGVAITPDDAISESKSFSNDTNLIINNKTSSPINSSSDHYKLPPFNLLQKGSKKGKRSQSALRDTANALQQVLSDFGINASVVQWIAGPTVTLFEVDLPAGVRVSRVTALNDDIALALASPGVRIFAPVPGTNYVGIEVPNTERETVYLSDVLTHADSGPLQIAIGKDVEGNSIVSDLAKMPHLLIGGTTGSGKSVSINAMIMSILMRATPDEVRFIMIDPKRVEFTPYNDIPHLYVPVVTEPPEAASALAWGVAEMERRLKIFSKLGVRNIGQYNKKIEELKCELTSSEYDKLDNPQSVNEDASQDYENIPYIVIVIDELADLMMNIGKEVEISISRIAQLARAAGIHLIVATQRPSTNVVTGLIKANITNRIAFNVASGIDSRVILDSPGAESLIGLGDMLLSKPELAKPQRIQACFVDEEEIFNVVEHCKKQGEPEYNQAILSTNVVTIGASSPSGGSSSGERDPYVWEAAEMIVSSGMGSTSNIQRRFKVGYARAGRIMDQLEELGVVGSANGSKPREVLIDALELESLKAFEENE